MNRRGVALVAVLWTVTLLSGVVGTAVYAVRVGQIAARNRMALTRARWAAEACVAIAQARWAAGSMADTATITLGRTRCRWRVDDPTAHVNLNTADGEWLARLFAAAGLDQQASTALAAATVERRARARFTDTRQLQDLPAFDPRVLALVTVDGSGVINASAAPAEVLQSIPGLSREAATRLIRQREAGRQVSGLDDLLGRLSDPSRAQARAHYAGLARILRFGPTRLVLHAFGRDTAASSRVQAELELLVVPLPERLAVLRRRLR